MLRNADVSYSSIAPDQSNDCSCCLCSCRFSCTSCCRCCILRLPYGTITASLLTVCGLVLAATAFMQSSTITERLFLELLYRKFLWLSEVRVGCIIVTAVIAIIVTVNLTVGFATTGKEDKERSSGGVCRTCCCPRGYATGCIVKTIFLVNYVLFYFILLLTLLFTVILFTCYILSRLCNEGRYTLINPADSVFLGQANYAENLQQIDLRQFSPIFELRSNETNLLLFKDHRLKKLCVDYMSSLLFYILLAFIGALLMTIGFVNFLITLSINWVRRTTKQKYAELFYINGAEMIAFDSGDDVPHDLSTRY